MLRIFVKDGRELPAYSPADAVNLRARGWVEKTFDGGALPSGVGATESVPPLLSHPAPPGVVSALSDPEQAEEKPRRRRSDSSEES